jgi:GT2 family glycosyltransferase
LFQPLVSIVILNYKRLDALELTLQSVAGQNYARTEVIVVDNHSEQDVAGVVSRFGAHIHLLQMGSNLGACGGRNAGIRSAAGEIVITLDNDVSFLSQSAIDRVVAIFQQHSDFHVLAFQLRDAVTGDLRLREWCHPRDWRLFSESQFETHYFVEGAAAYRREVFDSAGDYFEPLFVYNEGWDFGLRILDKGFRILYTPEIKVRHLMSTEARSNSRTIYFFTRNYLWIAYKDYPLWEGVRFAGFRLMMMCIHALRAGYPLSFLLGMLHGFGGWGKIDRRPVNKRTVAHIALLDRQRPNLFIRAMRHRRAPQL